MCLTDPPPSCLATRRSVKGEATLDLSKYRQHGQSIELWEKLLPTDAAKAPTGAGGAVAELHLTITYCPTKQVSEGRRRRGAGVLEDACMSWFDFGIFF